MKIEIELDLEALVREAIKEYIKENIIIHDISQGQKIGESILTITVGDPPAAATAASTKTEPPVEWEFAPRPGRRRSKEEIALHELELKHNRLLTPEEKGKAKAGVEIDETAESNAKEEAINQDRIDKMAKEGMDAASKEIAEEASTGEAPKEEEETLSPKEASIPKADSIDVLDSMFK